VLAYILGLPGERYRGAPLEEDLSGLGIAYEVVPGPDAAAWTAEDLERVYCWQASRAVNHRQMTAGEVACTLGHQEMMRRFADSGEPWALFFEDDARIVKPLEPVLAALPALPDVRMVIQLDVRVPLPPPEAGGVPLSDGILYRQPYPTWGAAAYLMNRAAALIALRTYRRRRVDSAADWPFCWSGRVQFWRPDSAFALHPRDWAASHLHAGRSGTFGRRPKRSIRRYVRSGLRITGLWALYGRLHGLPFFALYRKDLRQVRRKNRTMRGRG
jgi:hypothetical protein